ncbi:MAG: hypothetical protein QOJ65_2453 [Fimbriimonadaceae bacterium]|nr:hypothetical protein [Fimbriimonadaceae bacterium]
MFLRGVDYILAEGDEFLVPASEGLLRTFGSKVGREQVVLHEFDGFGTFRNLDLFRDWGGGLLLDYEADEKRLGVLASTTIETIVDLVACIALSNIDSPPAILTFPPYVYSWEREPYDCMVPQDVFNGLGYSFGFRAGGRRLSVNDSGVILLRVKR